VKTLSDSSTYSPDTYQPLHPSRELAAAKAALLTASPYSELAMAECASLLGKLFHQSGGKFTNKQLNAFAALVADLLERDPDDEGGWLFRSMDPASFTKGTVGYRPFTTVYTAMAGMMVEQVRGNRVWQPGTTKAGARVPHWQRATRFRATPWLRKWFSERGISRQNWADHFKRDYSVPTVSKATCPVVLRSGNLARCRTKPIRLHCWLKPRRWWRGRGL